MHLVNEVIDRNMADTGDLILKLKHKTPTRLNTICAVLSSKGPYFCGNLTPVHTDQYSGFNQQQKRVTL